VRADFSIALPVACSHGHNPRMPQRVVIALSGGVDSAVSALLLQQQGYEVHALFMRNWDEDEDGYCTAAQDLQDARRVCDELGIPLHATSFAAEYRDRVFRHFLDELESGRTPNPDVACNREIKFGVCFEHAQRLGADLFATGHYARTRNGLLLRGLDPAKDQSYFLHTVPQAMLARTLFPIGHLHKGEVRRLAQEHALPVHDKRDSTGICFIGERPFAEFLASYLPAQPGPIETPDGRTLGTHRGLMNYTLGQRQGIAVGGVRGAAEKPWYVAAKDLTRNALVVVQDHDHPLLLSDRIETEPGTWVAGAPPRRTGTFRCTVKLRHRQADQPCAVTVGPDGACVITTDAAQRAVTPGQSAVFYDGETCLGGGIIRGASATFGRVEPAGAGSL
jgi:tRNA-specific 2-thiouridylase